MQQKQASRDVNVPYRVQDVHFHPSNYAYQGVSLKILLRDYMNPNQITRSVVMPLPLQQRWDSFEAYEVKNPEDAFKAVGASYYIGTKADLYYYSFADAMYAKEYLGGLTELEQARLDLMITGFNPMDRYAFQHIKRALLTYPGAFVGIGEFTVHKEVVSNKAAGEKIGYTTTAEKLPLDIPQDGKLSLYAQSLRDILKFAEETGLVVTLHNDMYPVSVSYEGDILSEEPNRPYVDALIDLCQSSKATVIWAHTGLGRYVKPTHDHITRVEEVLKKCDHWRTDISWDLVQDWMMEPKPGMPSTSDWVKFLEKNNEKVLWGTDSVIFSRNKFTPEKGKPQSVELGKRMDPEEFEKAVLHAEPLFNQLSSISKNNIRYANYEQIFNKAKNDVRKWEAAHANDDVWDLAGPDMKIPPTH